MLSTGRQAIRAAAHAVSCSPAEITHAQLYADSTVRQLYVSLTAPPCPSIRHRLDDLITHPGSQRAFVADLAAGGISPHEISLCTTRVRVRRQYTLLSDASVASPPCVQLLSSSDHTPQLAVCRPISEATIRHSHGPPCPSLRHRLRVLIAYHSSELSVRICR